MCPFLSQLSYNFPAYEKEFLTESEKEDLELVCQASPMCTVTLPQVCDVGRTVELDVHIFPADSDVALRVVTDSSDIVDVDGCILYPRAAGTAEIAVYIGDDPYPVATEVIKVRQRNLITDISLFPSALYMPVGGTSELTLTIVPESAENKDEIRWSCDDHSVANVDFSSGVITLLKCKCVCEGFAKAFKFLCDKIDLECWVVSGKGSSSIGAGPHAWNIVKINGYYHHVDVTWDNQYSDSSSMPNYGYMNLSDDEIAKDHTWNKKHYPECPSSPYNYFRVNNALLDSKAQLESMLYNSLQMEEEFITFRVVRGSILEREINGCLTDCIQKAANRCKYISVPTFRYGGVPEQLTFFVQPDYCYR